MARTSDPHPNTISTSTEPPAIAGRYRSMRWRSVGYWLATVSVAAELGLGGIWDIARIPYVRDLVTHLGYPSYFLVLLGSWKVLGAIVSHLSTGHDLNELPLLAVLTALTVLSWALRPPSRRT